MTFPGPEAPSVIYTGDRVREVVRQKVLQRPVPVAEEDAPAVEGGADDAVVGRQGCYRDLLRHEVARRPLEVGQAVPPQAVEGERQLELRPWDSRSAFASGGGSLR